MFSSPAEASQGHLEKMFMPGSSREGKVCESPGVQDASWEFPKIGATLFGGPYNKDPTI